jgi:hypothetical protein
MNVPAAGKRAVEPTFTVALFSALTPVAVVCRVGDGRAARGLRTG